MMTQADQQIPEAEIRSEIEGLEQWDAEGEEAVARSRGERPGQVSSAERESIA